MTAFVAFLQHKKRRSTVDAHNIVRTEENFCESNVTTVSKIHSSEMEKLNQRKHFSGLIKNSSKIIISFSLSLSLSLSLIYQKLQTIFFESEKKNFEGFHNREDKKFHKTILILSNTKNFCFQVLNTNFISFTYSPPFKIVS